jgi:hypothetical protein
MNRKKVEVKRNMTWTPTREDWDLLRRMKQHLGVLAEAEVVRVALRTLARSLEPQQSN